jgi:hypothetical protein
MKIIISESQLVRLQESQGELFDMFDTDYLNLLYRNSKKGPNNPAYKLLGIRGALENESLVRDLNQSIETLYKFFNRKNSGLLPKILELALIDRNKTINDLKIVSNFINDTDFNDDVTKKQLLKLRNMTEVPDDLEDILRNVRGKEYSKYEKSYEGDYFEVKRTALSLQYKCGEDLDKSFLEKIQKFESVSVEEFEKLLVNIKNCVKSSLSEKVVIKSDISSKTPLYVMDNGVKTEVFKKGSNFEVKMMDVNIDSYLSEFFSIFKQTENKEYKGAYLEIYNSVIRGLYEWVKGEGQEYLNSIKNNMEGIAYENYIIVPIKYIDFYWSNVGQRGCNELRLSIRFRIKAEYQNKKIEAYVFTKTSDILEKKELKVSKQEVEKVVC